MTYKKKNQLPRNSSFIIIGGFKAKVRKDQQENRPDFAGKYYFGKQNQWGQQRLQFCVTDGPSKANTLLLYHHSGKQLKLKLKHARA